VIVFDLEFQSNSEPITGLKYEPWTKD